MLIISGVLDLSVPISQTAQAVSGMCKAGRGSSVRTLSAIRTEKPLRRFGWRPDFLDPDEIRRPPSCEQLLRETLRPVLPRLHLDRSHPLSQRMCVPVDNFVGALREALESDPVGIFSPGTNPTSNPTSNCRGDGLLCFGVDPCSCDEGTAGKRISSEPWDHSTTLLCQNLKDGMSVPVCPGFLGSLPPLPLPLAACPRLV